MAIIWDFATDERELELWKQQHRILVWTARIGIVAVAVATWWIAIVWAVRFWSWAQ